MRDVGARDRAGNGDEHRARIDIFRFGERGRIVGQWDVLHRVPDTAANDNTMFCAREYSAGARRPVNPWKEER